MINGGQLASLAMEFRKRNVLVDEMLNKVIISFPCDAWDVSMGNSNWLIHRLDKLTGEESTECLPQYVGVEGVASYITKLSVGIVNGVLSTTDEDLVRRTFNACRKKKMRAKYLFGYVFIENKFEAWCFIPKQGRIKLLHRNAHGNNRVSATLSGYHKQFDKVMEVEEVVKYIENHARRLYTPKRRRASVLM